MVDYLFNHLRIGLRERLLASACSEADADWIGSRSAYANHSMQSIGPLAFANLTTGAPFGPAAAPVLLVITGMALAGTTFAAATPWSRRAPPATDVV